MLIFLLTVAASALMIIAYVVYFNDIKKSKIVPNKFSWMIWSFAVSLETITYNVASQDIIKSICFYISAISCIVITYKIRGYSNLAKPSKTEKLSLIFCLLSLIILTFFNSVWFAHIVLLVSIPIACVPTYRSALKNYANEDSNAWILWSLSDLLILSIIILRLQTVQELAYGIVEFVVHFSVFAIIYIRKYKANNGLFISQNHLGKAVYSTKEYQEDETIIKFEGTKIHKKDLPEDISGNKDHYLQIDFDLYLGPSGKADDFINHSCNPNTGLFFKDEEVYLKALRYIEIGKEITFDYSTSTFQDDWRMECACGEKNCRKVITDFTYLDSSLQKKYIDLNIVAPFIRTKLTQNHID